MIASIRNSLAAAALLVAVTAYADGPFVLVVMDPLSKPLSCDCVRGYAQREYKLLAGHLEKSLGKEVQVVWYESLAEALDETSGKADLVIGKHSVVLADEASTGHDLRPLAQLTGKDGDVNQRGLIVVRGKDPAESLRDLDGYRVFFGPTDSAEKSSAAEAALKEAGVTLPENRERHGACSEAATALLELPNEVDAAAVISSYAEPLLEGCGSIKKGDLRVVGQTQPIPFVTAFVSEDLASAEQEEVLVALVTAGTNPKLLTGMETLAGFLPWTGKSEGLVTVKKKAGSDSLTDRSSRNRWTQFRGPNRDGRIDWLPDQLPDLDDDLRWSATVPSDGVGGLMVAEDVVIVSGRNASDTHDQFIALDLTKGRQRWVYQYAAAASLDYGNSPRATPAYSQGVLVTLGATGVLTGLDASTGVPLWTVDLVREFQVEIPTWGFSGSPLIIDDSVILQVADDPSMIAVDLLSGELRWRVSGHPSAYSSLISIRDASQVAGVSDDGYFIRTVKDGDLVWFAKPKYEGDFGVPTPVLADGDLIFTSENNGVQEFSVSSRRVDPQPSAVNDMLIPDSHSPVWVGNRLLVAHQGLHSLDPDNSLEIAWTTAESIIDGYASLIASDSRVLVTTDTARMLLVDIASKDAPSILSERVLTDQRASLLAHPAINGRRLLVRVGKEIRCYRLPK